MTECLCDCHKPGCSILPPYCFCSCNNMKLQYRAPSKFNYKIAEEKPATTIDYAELIDKIETLMKFREAYLDQLKIELEWKERIEKSIKEVEKALENYREYRTDIEDLGTDVMHIKGRLDNLEGYMEMEDRCTASDILLRLAILEKLITN